MNWPKVSSDPNVQSHYELCRSEGTSHNLAMIFATGRAPGCVTDREFFNGRGTLAQSFDGDETMLNKLADIAEKHGRRPRYTDYYEPALAEFPGDPDAFVPASEGRGHVKRVLEQRDLDSDGLVKNKSRGMRPVAVES